MELRLSSDKHLNVSCIIHTALIHWQRLLRVQLANQWQGGELRQQNSIAARQQQGNSSSDEEQSCACTRCPIVVEGCRTPVPSVCMLLLVLSTRAQCDTLA